ncbi:glycoside hydrolase family 3 N-terminal domain-containing protein [Haploplasma axanthum]|nr:glycoside hydrolase family 3 N-terminal domain-containing protein [Haploplasma axanthum]
MKELLKKMTIEEKLGQLIQIAPFFYIKDLKNELYGPAVDLGLSKEQIYKTGSVLGIGSPEEMIEVQKKYLENNRLGIPLMFMADIVHGYETIFPIPLAIASSWNEELITASARVSAKESITSGIHVTFSPMADLTRDPRWGRVMEGYGEDPYLNYRFSAAATKGYQGKNIKNDGIAACVKHFAAYGLSEAGREYNTVDLSEYQLKQNYLSGYQGAIDAGAKMVMTSFNLFNGIPATMNKHLIKDILREEMKFNGVVISDYNGLRETIIHGISKDNKDAAINCIDATLDIEMVSGTYMTELKSEFENGTLPIKLLDEAVLRILNLKNELGLFEDPFKGVSRVEHDKIVLSKSHLDYAKKAADESIVLLENKNNVLPLKENQKVFLIGPNAHERNLNGAWSWHGKRDVNENLFDLLSKKNLVHNIDAADVVVYFGGEKFNESGEAKSKTDINFNFGQLEEIKKLSAYGKPIITVVASGRPLILTDVAKHSDAVIQAWFLGTKAAESISDVIYGNVNPSGKLTMTFPRSIGQVPIYYNALNTGRPKNNYDNEYTSVYIDSPNTPLYPFGYGLSYSKFVYGEIKLNKEVMRENEKIVVEINVSNDSSRAGFETIQLYIRDIFAKVSRPLKELKKYQKVWFEANETKTISFEITESDLVYYDSNLKQRIDEGDFIVYVGPSSDNVKENIFKYSGRTKEI